MEDFPLLLQDWLDLIREARSSESRAEYFSQTIKQLSDVELLKQLALRISESEFFRPIIEKLEDGLLIEILEERSDPELQNLIVERISSPDILLNTLKLEFSSEIRQRLANRLINDKSQILSDNLIRLIDQEEDSLVKAIFISKIPLTEVEKIHALALGEEHIAPRLEATRLVNDQKILAQIIKNEQNGDIRMAAVKNMAVPYILKDTLRTDLYWKVRIEALKLMCTEKSFEYVLNNDPSPEIRLFALEHTQNTNLLAEIAMNELDRELRENAVKRLIEIGDQETLWVIAEKETIPEIQLLAIKNISNHDILHDIISKIDNIEVYEKAIQKVEDINLLADQLRKGRNLKLNRIIVKRLIELEAVDKLGILQNETSGSVTTMIQDYLETV